MNTKLTAAEKAWLERYSKKKRKRRKSKSDLTREEKLWLKTYNKKKQKKKKKRTSQR